jgi:hypothetical protein
MSSTILARHATARRVRLYHKACALYNRRRERYRASLGTADEPRCLDRLARAMERELRLLPAFLR